MKRIVLFLAVFALVFGTAAAEKKASATKPAPCVKVVTLPENTKNEDILNAIKKPYKGTVVVIDFWATWCGPCMAAMKSIDPIKEKYLKDKKKVSFVYVTGETSPLADFNKAIPSIKGYHYRLSNAQFKALMSSLGIRGIPSYMIVNKDGSKAYDNIAQGGYPGDDIIIAEVDKALAK